MGPATYATYRELASRVSALAGSLRGRYRLQPGDRIGVTLTNCPQYFEVLFALWHAGLTAVPINAKLHQREFHYILSQSGAPDLEATIAPLVEELPDLERVICTAGKDYQGMLVSLSDVTTFTDPYDCSADIGSCMDTDLWEVLDAGATGILVYDRAYANADWVAQKSQTGVVGVMTFRFDRRRIQPRSAADLTSP